MKNATLAVTNTNHQLLRNIVNTRGLSTLSNYFNLCKNCSNQIQSSSMYLTHLVFKSVLRNVIATHNTAGGMEIVTIKYITKGCAVTHIAHQPIDGCPHLLLNLINIYKTTWAVKHFLM